MRRLSSLRKKDLDLLEVTVLYLLNNGVKGEAKEISNPDSGFSATLKLVSESTKEEDFTTLECRTMFYEGYKKGRKVKDSKQDFLQGRRRWLGSGSVRVVLARVLSDCVDTGGTGSSLV